MATREGLFGCSSDSATRKRLAAQSILASAALLFATASVLAEIPTFQWEEPEVVEAGVLDIPDPSGTSISPGSFTLDDEHSRYVVYAKDGEIYLRTCDRLEWLPALQISNDPADSREPRIGINSKGIDVVWEDDRSGHPEIWIRSFRDSVWSGETCLSCDATSSRSPALAVGYVSHDNGLVAWEDGQPGLSRIVARVRNEWTEEWQPIVNVSPSPAHASQPTAACSDDANAGLEYVVAWTDTRHGQSEIYQRICECAFDGTPVWDSELRVTNLSGNCTHPAVDMMVSGGGVLVLQSFLTFENDASGVTEAWSAYTWNNSVHGLQRISPDDGLASFAPGVGGFSFRSFTCGFYGNGYSSRYFPIWTEEPVPGQRRHSLLQFKSYNTPPAGPEILSSAGAGRASVTAMVGNPAEVFGIYIEERESVPTLMARRGRVVGCHEEHVVAPEAILITPEGNPANRVVLWETCADEPQFGITFQLEFEAALDGALAWDEDQLHPLLDQVITHSDGAASIPIRGGGCSEAGSVNLKCINWLSFHQWHGVRSPDVDGDCLVETEDLQYVESRMGSDDFCADLDGSGLVDASDRAIVVATLGDHCSQVTVGLDGSAVAGSSAVLEVFPNPCRDRATLRLGRRLAGGTYIQIVDAGGRVVRRLRVDSAGAGTTVHSSLVPWDLRDDAGRALPSGVYSAVARTGSERQVRPIIVVR